MHPTKLTVIATSFCMKDLCMSKLPHVPMMDRMPKPASSKALGI